MKPVNGLVTSPLIELARNIAIEAHKGQTRRDGKTPYIVHPFQVAARLRDVGESDEVIAVALCHDVLEDSNLTATNLLERGLSPIVVNAVDVLTKRPMVLYHSYLAIVRANPIARKVKIADMLANLADDPTPRQIRKYAEGLLYLTDPV